MSNPKQIHAKRSPEARAADEKQRHSNIINPADAGALRRWQKNPGSADIVGIDTPSGGARMARPAETRKLRRMQTERGRAQDLRRTNKNTISRVDSRLPEWRKDPGSMDVQGVDTPRRTRSPRITPKQPRLRR